MNTKLHRYNGMLLTTLITGLLLAGCAADGKSRSTGQVLDDASVSTRIKTALLADGTTDGLDIEVEVDRGRVQLTGFADSQAEVDRASAIARDTRGVASVDNQLQVAEGSRRTGEYIDDKVLVGKVNAALAKDSNVKSLNIDVEVNRGMVSLGGFVDTMQEKTAAEAAARRVAGVRRVANNLTIR